MVGGYGRLEVRCKRCETKALRLNTLFGGRGGIRTHGTLAGTPVFKTGALNHSATLPSLAISDLAGAGRGGKCRLLRGGTAGGALRCTLTGRGVVMFGKASFFALAFAGCLLAPMPCLAQDAGVSGIPRGPGSAGGLNNSVNDPSGVGNAARIPPPPPPSMAVPAVPSIAPTVSSRVSPRSTLIVRRADRQRASSSRRGSRRSSAHATTRDSKFNICRGC